MMLTKNVALWKRWSLNIVILTFIVAFLYFTFVFQIVGHRQGFFCDNQFLKFKYQKDTITSSPVFAVSIGVPLMVIVYTEGFTKQAVDLLGGFIILSIIVRFSKLMIGELRPHFWDSCKPNVTTAMCSDGYVTQYECTTDAERIWSETPFFSFPSGHSTTSSYGMMFFIIYLQRRLTNDASFPVLLALQILCVIWILFCSITRVTDHRHHIWDVVAGDLLGVTGAIIATVYRSIKLPFLSNDQHQESSDNDPQPRTLA